MKSEPLFPGDVAVKTGASQSADNTKIRVLLVPGFVVDTYSEIERSFVELCSDSDHDIEFLWLVPDGSSKQNRFARPESAATLKEPVWVPHLRSSNVPYVVGNVSKYNPISNFLLFRALFRTHRIDAVYTHFGFERYWAVIFGKLFGKVTIWNEHWHSLGRRYAGFKRLFYRLFVDEFISISRFITGTLPTAARVHTILNAIHANGPKGARAEQESELRRQLGIAQDAMVVLMVAAFRPEKRHTLALRVCERVLKEWRDVVFVFLGEGSLRAPFLAKAKDMGLEAHVVAPGYVDNVEDYYTVADISVLTSHYEPFGYVVLEAMRHALPVVAFNTGGPAEVIRHEDTGFLVADGDIDEFAQRVLDLAENKELRTTIGERARQSVQQEHNRAIWVKQLKTTLRQIVIGKRMRSFERLGGV